MNESVERFLRVRRYDGFFTKLLIALSFLVVGGTLLVLMLPAIALTHKETVLSCAYQVHAHEDSCYLDVYDDYGNVVERRLVCGLADYAVHVHNDDCYDAEGMLVCPLPELEAHRHTDECYETNRVLACGQEESAGHVHSEDCYAQQPVELVCKEFEHIHSDACYESILVCGEQHEHTDVCFERVLTCGFDEHAHTDDCYRWDAVLSCGQEESAGHTHTDACYTEERALVCGKAEVIPHIHDDSCYETELDEWGNVVAVYRVCTLPQVETHVHGADCLHEIEMPVEEVEALAEKQDEDAPEEIASADEEENIEDTETGTDEDSIVNTEAVADEDSIVNTEAVADENSIENTETAGDEDDIDAWLFISEDQYLGDEDAGIEEEVPEPEDDSDAPSETEVGEAAPAVSFEAGTEDVRVCVSADEGAFPAGTEMAVVPVDDGAVLDAAQDVVEGSVIAVKAVEIIFTDAEGEEVAPAMPIQVTLASDVVAEAEETVVVSVDTDGMAAVVEQTGGVQSDVLPAADEVVFDAEAFPVYAIVGTTIEKNVLASDGHNYRITAAYLAETGIPADAELEVTEVTDGSSVYGMSYEEYVSCTENALGMEEGSAEYIRLFDIKIVDGQDHSVKYQPKDGSTVDIRIELADAQNDAALSVVHFEDGSESGERVESSVESSAPGQIINFEANGFSIYAIVDDGVDRLVYRFYDGSTLVSTQYIKKYVSGADENTGDYIYSYESLYDPGISSSLDEDEIFVGWAEDPNETDDSKIFTLTQLNAKAQDMLEAGNFDDLTEKTYYAIIKEAYFLQYLITDDNGATTQWHSEKIEVKDGADASYYQKIIIAAPNLEEGQTADGWMDSSTGRIYTPGDTITVDHSIDLYLKLHGNNWLVFDANAGGPGSGAAYTPPQLLIGSDDASVTEQPTDPTRTGYNFVGWNTEPDGSGTWWYKYMTDADGSVMFVDGEPIADSSVTNQFGGKLSGDTTLYAQWSATDTVYYIVLWKQRVTDEASLDDADKKYDYVQTIRVDSKTDAHVDIPAQYTTLATNTNANSDFYQTKYNSVNSDTDGAIVKADGTTVLNVYYDLNEYTLTFVDGSSSSANITYVYNGRTYSDAPVGDAITNNSYISTLNSNKKTISNYVVSYYQTGTGRNRQTYYAIQIDGAWYTITSEGQYVYNASSITSVPNNKGGKIKEITALYGHSIASEFPIVGANGVTYYGYVWDPQNSNIFTTGQVPSLETMPAESTTFSAMQYGTARTAHMYYYVQAITAGEDDLTYNGQNYNLHQHITIGISSGITSTKAEDFYAIEGYTQYASNPVYGSNGSVSLSNSNNYSINFFYTRNKYNIDFVSRSEVQKTESVYYEADLSGFGYNSESGTWFFEPTNGLEGEEFVGWYLDSDCVTPFDFNSEMPANNIVLYAKWEKTRVRTVLVPTPDNANNEDVYFPNNQALTFRLDYNEPVSDANINGSVAKRLGYKLVGWYTSPTFEEETLWNFSTPVNKTVSAVDMKYQSSDDWANNTYGDNDGEHLNVKGILKLYAKWEPSIEENAVYINYEVPDDYLLYDQLGNLQTVIPVDDTAYMVLDENNNIVNQTRIATAPVGYNSDYEFAGWQMLDADGNVVDTINPMDPGTSWMIDSDYAASVQIEDQTMNVITFRAVFTIRQEQATQVVYDGNGGTSSETGNESQTISYPINQNFDLLDDQSFTREGYAFVGWSFLADADPALFKDADGVVMDQENNLIGFSAGASVAADNWDITSQQYQKYNDADNTLYAVWEIKKYTVTIKKLVDESTPTAEKFSFSATGLSEDTFKLAHNEESVFENIPYGTKFMLTETPVTGYSVKSVDAKQTTDPAGNALNESAYIDLSGADGKEYEVKGDITITYTNVHATVPVRVVKVDQEARPLAGARFSFVGEKMFGGESALDMESAMDESGDAVIVEDAEAPLGTYVLHEDAPPAGYIGMDGDAEITISSDDNGSISVTLKIGETEITSPTFISKDSEGTWVIKLMNSAGYALPSTGGVGTRLFHALGGLTVLAAGALLLRRRRKIGA